MYVLFLNIGMIYLPIVLEHGRLFTCLASFSDGNKFVRRFAALGRRCVEDPKKPGKCSQPIPCKFVLTAIESYIKPCCCYR